MVLEPVNCGGADFVLGSFEVCVVPICGNGAMF